jgi:hypothetical protein
MPSFGLNSGFFFLHHGFFNLNDWIAILNKPLLVMHGWIFGLKGTINASNGWIAEVNRPLSSVIGIGLDFWFDGEIAGEIVFVFFEEVGEEFFAGEV